MKNIIIFGSNQTAQLANYYLSNSDEFNVIAFTVHKKYRNNDMIFDKPLVNFEDIESIFPPDKYYLFCPMTGKDLNRIREQVYLEGKSKGYQFISYISNKATVLTEDIGENCFILEDNTIQPFVKIGNNCVLWSGNHIGHHSTIEDNVFITSHCVISGNCIIKKYSWLGVNCTLRNNITIEEGCVIAMSSSVTKNTNKYRIYMGVPAKDTGNSEDIALKL